MSVSPCLISPSQGSVELTCKRTRVKRAHTHLVVSGSGHPVKGANSELPFKAVKAQLPLASHPLLLKASELPTTQNFIFQSDQLTQASIIQGSYEAAPAQKKPSLTDNDEPQDPASASSAGSSYQLLGEAASAATLISPTSSQLLGHNPISCAPFFSPPASAERAISLKSRKPQTIESEQKAARALHQQGPADLPSEFVCRSARTHITGHLLRKYQPHGVDDDHPLRDPSRPESIATLSATPDPIVWNSPLNPKDPEDPIVE